MTTITQKRATLYREWLLAGLGNDERYYYSTLSLGIPDGDDQATVMADLTDGFYDDEIDETLAVYSYAKEEYGADGYYVNGKLLFDEDQALAEAGYIVPERIYKH